MWEVVLAFGMASQVPETVVTPLDVQTTTVIHQADVEAVAALLEASARGLPAPERHWLPGATIEQRGLPDISGQPAPLTSQEIFNLVRGCRSGNAARGENETVRVVLHCAGQTRALNFAMDGSRIRSIVFEICCTFSAPPPGVPGRPENAQRWRPLLPYQLPAGFEYEMSTLSRRGQIVSVWMRWNAHRVAGSTSRPTGRHLQRAEIDCRRGQMAIRQFFTFDLRGVVLAEESPSAEEPILAGSIADHLRRVGCGANQPV